MEQTPNLINGEWRTFDETLEVRSPWSGEVVGVVPSVTSREVDEAVQGARRWLRSGAFPQHERAAVLERAGRLIEQRVEDFARTIALEAAKPIKTARVEAQRAANTLTYAAVEARRLAGEVVPMEGTESGAGKLGVVLRVPVGVVGAISPFNFPLNLVMHKVAPAVAAGAPVVLKPASSTPLSALKLARLFEDAGLPPGFLSVVTGKASAAGNAIVDHPDVRYITFTGSQDVGWGIVERAPRKKVRLELGSASPLIVHEDGDFETAAKKAAVSAFTHAGQSCISIQRIYVHRGVEKDFVSAFLPLVDDLVIGDPLDEKTDVSQLISEDERDRVKSWVDEALDHGASLLSCCNVVEGVLCLRLLRNVMPQMKLWS